MSDRLTFPIGRCDRDDKVNPAVEHLANKQGCFVRNIFCSDFTNQLKVDLVCPSRARLAKVKKSLTREMVLFKHHGLAGETQAQESAQILRHASFKLHELCRATKNEPACSEVVAGTMSKAEIRIRKAMGRL